MGIRFDIKRNTAAILFMAFIFRLLFLNIYQLTSTEASGNKKIVPAHFTTVLKKRKRDTEEIARLNVENFVAFEACEENSDTKEDLIKANSQVFLSFLHTFIQRITDLSGSNNPFDTIKSHLFPKTYLAFSILRV